MALTVATNTGALTAQAAASNVNKSMDTAMERLSTGLRINSAADDAAGVAVSSRLTAEIKGLEQGVKNAMSAQALIDTAEGAHAEIENILQRMRELAVQAANDTNSLGDRTNLQAEVNQLVSEIDRIANSSSWAGNKLIDAAHTFKFQIGPRGSDASNTLSVSMNAMTGAALGVAAGNASVGVNGATAIEVGESVTGVSTVQFGGTPAVGDVYSMDLNGQTITLEIAAVSGSDFTYKFKADGVNYDTNGVGAYSNATNNPVGGGAVSGQTTTSVANAFKNVINGTAISGGTKNGDVVATVNSDGTLTVGKTINVSVTTANDGQATPAALTVTQDSTTTVGTTIVTLAAASGQFAEDINLAINNVNIDVDLSDASQAAYADDANGMVAGLQAAIQTAQDAGNLAGLTFTVTTGTYDGAGAGDIRITIVDDTAGRVSNVGVNPGTTTAALQINSQANASAAIATIDTAITTLNTQRASLGAYSNRLDSTVRNLTNISTNLAAGRSLIQDADFASETTELARTQILQQASTAMLAQANASKQTVLSLLQG